MGDTGGDMGVSPVSRHSSSLMCFLTYLTFATPTLDAERTATSVSQASQRRFNLSGVQLLSLLAHPTIRYARYVVAVETSWLRASVLLGAASVVAFVSACGDDPEPDAASTEVCPPPVERADEGRVGDTGNPVFVTDADVDRARRSDDVVFAHVDGTLAWICSETTGAVCTTAALTVLDGLMATSGSLETTVMGGFYDGYLHGDSHSPIVRRGDEAIVFFRGVDGVGGVVDGVDGYIRVEDDCTIRGVRASGSDFLRFLRDRLQ